MSRYALYVVDNDPTLLDHHGQPWIVDYTRLPSAVVQQDWRSIADKMISDETEPVLK